MPLLVADWKTNAAETPLLDNDESVFETPETPVQIPDTERWRNAVYEPCDTALWRKHLVLTPYMLLDRLKVCADLASEGTNTDIDGPQNYQLERIQEEINHLLDLLWRSGLWIDTKTVEKTAVDGQSYTVLCEPFTDGKPQGKPLSPDAPDWVRDMLGVSPP